MPSIPRPGSLGPSSRRSADHRSPVPPPVPAARAVVDCGVYVDGRRLPGHHDYREAARTVAETGEGFVWLGLHAPDDHQMESVAQTFGLHPLMVEDAVNAHQRPKLELYGDTLFLVLRSMRYLPHENLPQAGGDVVEAGEIMVLAGANFVITVRHGEHTQLAGVRERLADHPQRLSHGPATVVHAIADHVVDSYLDLVGQIQSDVDEIEEAVFGTAANNVGIDVVYLFKREILEMRRAAVPLTGPLSWLAGGTGGPGAPHAELGAAGLPESFSDKEHRRHFRDVADHLSTVVELVSEFDERLTSLMNAAATKVGIQQNTDMRKISAWAAIAAAPTMIAGVYGMNFDNMPELSWDYSYPVVLLVLAGICFLLYRTFHRNGWL
ncbi:magnesium and cobalt transport protein CorA [Gordonia sp. VNK21]|uniref:magnesium and cobalt transport protein CorA n=1 Tax=Gordonia sp. VNK21 TaxID=3382483 RepID=UPI0038D3FBFD